MADDQNYLTIVMVCLIILDYLTIGNAFLNLTKIFHLSFKSKISPLVVEA